MTINLTEEEQARVLAYADKALSAPEMAATRQWIEETADARVLLGQFDQSALPYAEAMAPMLDIPVADNIVSQVTASAAKRPGGLWKQSIAALVLLGVGVTVGTVVQNGNSSSISTATADSWVAQVANYQQLYVRPTVDVAGPVNHVALAKMIEANLKTPLPIPDFSAEEVTFRRGQLLQVNGNPLIQLAYLPKTGLPIAFCIMKDASAVDTALASGKSHGMHYQSWSQGGLRFVLLGNVPASTIESLTSIARSQLAQSKSA